MINSKIKINRANKNILILFEKFKEIEETKIVLKFTNSDPLYVQIFRTTYHIKKKIVFHMNYFSFNPDCADLHHIV